MEHLKELFSRNSVGHTTEMGMSKLPDDHGLYEQTKMMECTQLTMLVAGKVLLLRRVRRRRVIEVCAKFDEHGKDGGHLTEALMRAVARASDQTPV